MEDYTMTHTGAQLDEAAALALNPDTTPTLNSQNLVTSGGVKAALDGKAPVASPTFTGTPKAPTPTSGDDSTKIATTAFVQAVLGGVKGIYPCTTSTTFAQITAALAAGKLPVLIEMVEGYTIAYVYSNGGPAEHQFFSRWMERILQRRGACFRRDVRQHDDLLGRFRVVAERGHTRDRGSNRHLYTQSNKNK